MNDWCVIVVRFLRFHFVFFSQKEKERGDKQGIESTSIICKRRMQMIASERKRSDILSIQNARERIALLILMRSSRHGPFRDFFERFTLCVGGGRKGESVGPKPRKEYQFWIRSGRPFEREKERERRENRREDSLSLSLFPFPFPSLPSRPVPNWFLSVLSRDSRSRGWYSSRRTSTNDSLWSSWRTLLSRFEREKRGEKKRALANWWSNATADPPDGLSFLLSSFYFSGRYVQGFDSLVNLITARLDLSLPVAWVDRIADVVA